MFANDGPTIDPDTAKALERLDEIAEVGMTVVRTIGEAIKAPGADVVGLTNSFARASRAVRLTIMLEARLRAEGLAGAGQADATRRAALIARRDAAAERALDRDPAEEPAAARERAEGPDRERPERLGDLTVDETLDAIRDGLGLEHPIDLTADDGEANLPDVATLIERITARDRPHKQRAIVPALPP